MECNKMCKSGSLSALPGYSRACSQGGCSSQSVALELLSCLRFRLCLFCVRGEILVGGGASGGRKTTELANQCQSHESTLNCLV